MNQAKDTYENKKFMLEEEKKKGEDVWMLPSVNSRLSSSGSDEDEVQYCYNTPPMFELLQSGKI